MGIDGKQLRNTSILNTKLAAGILSADATGRALMATDFFDSSTVTAKFASAAIALDRLAEAVIQADGGQAFTADQPMGGFKLTGLGDGTAATDAATKGQVDALAAGLSWKEAVKLATTTVLPAVTYANGTAGVGATLTADAVGVLTVDGTATVLNDRLLIQDQAAGLQNGIYEVTTEGTAGVAFILTRATQSDESAEIDSAAVFVQSGSTNADNGFTQTADAPTMGTTALVFVQFTGTAGITFGTPGAIEPDDAAAEGVSSDAARSDHTHSNTAVAPSVTVKSENTAASEGAATSFLRSDAQFQVATATPGTTIQSDAGAAAQGSADTTLRSDAQILAATAAPSAVGTANAQGSSTSLARADHIHDAPAATTGNKEMTASVTSSDFDQATATTVAATPALDSYVEVLVNGVQYIVGDGVKTKDCYFSGDAGTTARSISAIVATDTLHWVGSVAGFELAGTDVIDLNYEIF